MNVPDPCPRCGSACEAVSGPVPDRWGVRCIECGLWADDREGTEAEAIAAWNRRALPARGVGVPTERPDAPAHIVEYTNWRGETARRTIIPIHMWWGSTEWHPQEQWMLTAWDVEKDAARDFAWQDMRPVQNGATSAALAALAPASAPDLSDPVTVHVNMLRGTIAKPTVEQIIHLYGRGAFQPMIDASIAKALEKACLAVSEHADWPEDEHGRTEQVGLFARVINAIRAITPTDAIAALPARGVGVPTDPRPANCRFRLKDEGKPYGRSSCSACGKSVFTGLGNSCSNAPTDAAHVNETPKSEHDAGNVLTAAQARECCDLCGSDVTDMDGHLVHDEGCNGDTYAPAAQAREAAFLGVCDCGMTGPCMWDQCKHPLINEART